MVILKKIKASSLFETLIATILIVVIFMVASFAMNNLFGQRIKNNTSAIQTELLELEYFYKNGRVTIPYFEVKDDWTYTINKTKNNSKHLIELKAFNSKTKKTLTRSFETQ